MSKNFENKYANLKNYELESMFDLSKRQKAELESNIPAKAKHDFKLQEFYLRIESYQYERLERNVLAYLAHHEYLLEDEQIAKFYELLAFAAYKDNNSNFEKYINKAIETDATKYCIKHALYNALFAKNIHLGARLMLIAIEADIEFDNELSYYNLIVEHYFEDDIVEYYKLMENYRDTYISVDNVTIEFNFNKQIVNYYLQKYVLKSEEAEVLKAKKEANELLLKTISSMKDESDLRSQVLRVRSAIATIDNNPDVDIFELITFNLLPKPSGDPESSPFQKIKESTL